MKQLSTLLAVLALAGSFSLKAQRFFGLNNLNQLVVFNAASPSTIERTTLLTGLVPGSNLVGLDFRPSTGELYGITFTNILVPTAQLVKIDTASGVLTNVGQPILNIDLSGRVTFDFNPSVDKIRLETSNDLNFRMDPDLGTIIATDGNLKYSNTDPNAGINPNIACGAYTRSYIATTSTALYVYDDSLNIFALQSPPNAGTLNTIGGPGFTVNPMDLSTDFDIWFDPVTRVDEAYFVSNNDNSNNDSLYRIDLSTGAATNLGLIGTGVQLSHVAIAIDRSPLATSGTLAYALNSNNFLCSFYIEQPKFIVAARQLSGISTGYTVEGIDYRPLTGEMFAFAYNRTTDAAKLYTVNPSTALATQVGNDSILGLGLGSQINFDFNPTVDRIRLSSSNGKNYRLNPITGALAATDGSLKYSNTDINAGAKAVIGANAYTNSYAGASSTTLYVYDDSLNIFATQIPPNDGVLNTIGLSGITVDRSDESTDFDIRFDTTLNANLAYFVANPSGMSFDNLYLVNLSTGGSSLLGNIGYGIAIKHFSLAIDRTAPNPEGLLVHAVSNNNNLLSFYTGNSHYIRSQVAFNGLPAGYSVVGTDFRPVGGQLYVLAYNASTQAARLYTVNTTTGLMTQVGTDSISPIDLSGRVGFDFNPTVDRIRVETSNNLNFRLHPVTGALVAADGSLKYAATDVNAGKDPNIGSVAYTNSRAGATSTALYVYDDSLNVLALQSPPNDGVLNTIGSSGITQNLADQSSDLDVYYDPQTDSNTVVLCANTDGNDRIYSIDIATGAANLLGKIGFGIAIKDIALGLNPQSVNIAEQAKVAELGIKAWPVPTSTELNIASTKEDQNFVSAEIISLSGQVIMAQSFNGAINQVSLDVADLKSGMYLLRLSMSNGEVAVLHFVK